MVMLVRLSDVLALVKSDRLDCWAKKDEHLRAVEGWCANGATVPVKRLPLLEQKFHEVPDGSRGEVFRP